MGAQIIWRCPKFRSKVDALNARRVRRSTWCIFILGCFTGALARADTEYFPPRALNGDNQTGGYDIMVRAYSKALGRMNEPSLWRASREDKDLAAYRFLWMPTWGRPVAVRIEKTGGRVKLTLVQLDGDGGYDPGEVAVSQQISLNEKQWDRLAGEVETAAFWNMPPNINDSGIDGENLIVEGVKDGKYHVVERWCPPRTGAFWGLCRTLLDLSGKDFGERNWHRYQRASRWTWVVPSAVAVILAVKISIAIRRRSGGKKTQPQIGLMDSSPADSDEFPRDD